MLMVSIVLVMGLLLAIGRLIGRRGPGRSRRMANGGTSDAGWFSSWGDGGSDCGDGGGD